MHGFWRTLFAAVWAITAGWIGWLLGAGLLFVLAAIAGSPHVADSLSPIKTAFAVLGAASAGLSSFWLLGRDTARVYCCEQCGHILSNDAMTDCPGCGGSIVIGKSDDPLSVFQDKAFRQLLVAFLVAGLISIAFTFAGIAVQRRQQAKAQSLLTSAPSATLPAHAAR